MNKGFDIEGSFQRLLHFAFPVYLNKRIERTADGYKVFDTTYSTWEEATHAVDEFYENFNKTVSK